MPPARTVRKAPRARQAGSRLLASTCQRQEGAIKVAALIGARAAARGEAKITVGVNVVLCHRGGGLQSSSQYIITLVCEHTEHKGQ